MTDTPKQEIAKPTPSMVVEQVEPIKRPHVPAMAKSATVARIATAITAVMAEVGHVAKTGFNEFHRYRYATMESVLQKITPLAAKHGLAFIQTEINRTMFDGDKAIAVEYEFTIMHSSGEVWPERPRQSGMSRCRDSKGNFDDKALNKCHTSARKYFLLALFNIPTGDEDDADAEKAEWRPIKGAPTKLKDPPQANVIEDAPAHDPETGELDDEPVPEEEDFSEAEAYMAKWRKRMERAVPADLQKLKDDWNAEKDTRNMLLWHNETTRRTFGDLVASGITALSIRHGGA